MDQREPETMKEIDNFDVVWSGGELLPPRRSKPPRWWTMGAGHALNEQDPKEAARLKEALRPKRAYHRKQHGRVSVVQSGSATPAGQSDATGEGSGGHSPEPVQTLTNPQTTTATE